MEKFNADELDEIMSFVVDRDEARRGVGKVSGADCIILANEMLTYFDRDGLIEFDAETRVFRHIDFGESQK